MFSKNRIKTITVEIIVSKSKSVFTALQRFTINKTINATEILFFLYILLRWDKIRVGGDFPTLWVLA